MKKIFLSMSLITLTLSMIACTMIDEAKSVFDQIFDEIKIIYHETDHNGSVKDDLELPTISVVSPEAVLTWSSSHPEVITDDGQVTRPNRSMWVVLNLTIELDGDDKTKEYPMFVISLDDDTQVDTYKVTFNFNNGDSAVVLDVKKDMTVTRPSDPVRVDYNFLNWFLNESVFDFNTPVTHDLTLNAHWEPLSSDGRKITFFDDFDGDALDLSKWAYQEGTGSEYGIWAWGNSEKQYYTRNNIEVSNGSLHIHAKKEQFPGADNHFQYTSGKLVTYETHDHFRTNEDGFRQTYGRFEIRMKAPLGDGFWPAFWLMPAGHNYGNGWPYNGEIDIVELRGREPFKLSSAVHFSNVGPHNGGYNGGHHSYLHNDYTLTGGASIDEFNIYAVEWQPGKLEFSVNDVVYHTRLSSDFGGYSGSAPFDQPFYIIINLAVGGHFDGFREPSLNDFPAKLEVDWVRVYEGLNI